MTYIRYGDKHKMFREHQKTLETIGKKYEEYSRLKKMISQNLWDMEEMENTFKVAVNNSVDKDGKPMHKNAEARSSAIVLLIRSDERYNKIRTINSDIEDQLIDIDNDIKLLKHKLHFFEVNA